MQYIISLPCRVAIFSSVKKIFSFLNFKYFIHTSHILASVIITDIEQRFPSFPCEVFNTEFEITMLIYTIIWRLEQATNLSRKG